MSTDILSLLPAHRGHFVFESGHHGSLWLDLERLCLHVEPIKQLARQLAERIKPIDAELVCGPLTEGAFVALMVALELGIPFTYSERFEDKAASGLYPIRYRIPGTLREVVKGRRVAIINDVINAGSAVGKTYDDLLTCEAIPVAIGTLVVLGAWAPAFAKARTLSLEALLSMPNEIWTPAECPLCASGIAISNASRDNLG
jgi:orotate phosphoribosyltransferase